MQDKERDRRLEQMRLYSRQRRRLASGLIRIEQHGKYRVAVKVDKTCEHCGASFEPQRSTARFCSDKCRVYASRSRDNKPKSPTRRETRIGADAAKRTLAKILLKPVRAFRNECRTRYGRDGAKMRCGFEAVKVVLADPQLVQAAQRIKPYVTANGRRVDLLPTLQELVRWCEKYDPMDWGSMVRETSLIVDMLR
jgi:hypothetical protein